MRRSLELQGYQIQSGQHRHLKFRHQTHGEVLLPLRPSQSLSHVALKQIASAMGTKPAELLKLVK